MNELFFSKEEATIAYKTLRRAICKNFIVGKQVNEESLTLNDLLTLINDVGSDYARKQYQERIRSRRLKPAPVCGMCGSPDCYSLACMGE